MESKHTYFCTFHSRYYKRGVKLWVDVLVLIWMQNTDRLFICFFFVVCFFLNIINFANVIPHFHCDIVKWMLVSGTVIRL